MYCILSVGQNISMNLLFKPGVGKIILLAKISVFFIFEWNVFADTCFRVSFCDTWSSDIFCLHYPTMLGEGGGVRGGVIGEWMIKFKQFFFILFVNPFYFNSHHLRLLLDFFSLVCPWSWLSKVVATDTLRVWIHFKYFFFFQKFLDKIFLALSKDCLHIHWKCIKIIEKCWHTF